MANPGCYATSSHSGAGAVLKAGFVDRNRGIISDSKSGVSGAGKEADRKTHFVSVADNLSAYSVFNHRHVGEIVEQIGLGTQELTFTPHLLPIPRGILSTIYVQLESRNDGARSGIMFQEFLFGQAWVRMFPDAEASASAVLAAYELLRPRISAWQRTGGGWC